MGKPTEFCKIIISMRQIALFLLITLFCGSVYGQSPYQNVQISNQLSPEEPSICVNPKNTNQLAAGANIYSYYWSTNGGLTWTRNSLTNSSWGVWGDPCIVVDTNGAFYYFHLSNTSTNQGGYWIDRIVCQKSIDGGATYSNPGSYTYFNPPRAQQDKEWAIVDRRSGARGNWIYVTWTQFDHYNSNLTTDSSRILFARSTDGGLTWVGVQRINKLSGDCLDEDNTVEGAVPAVGPNSEIYVAWAGPLVFNSQFKIFFDKSTDGGNTWLANDIIVADQIGGWDYMVSGLQRCNGLPITCCDVSNGPYRGTIYINWTDGVSGDHDVKIAKSTNGGLNWSAPIRVNDDPAGKEQFLTWMTIDQVTGYIYVVFYDRRNYSDNNTDVYLARSTNGGASFTNERISASSFLPTSGTFFGDYNNITAHNGKIRPIWTRLVSGSLSVWTAIIDFPVGVETAENETPSRFSLEQNYPNPFNAETVVRYQLSDAGQITMKLYDNLGREVGTLLNDWKEPGSYQLYWDAEGYPSGVYYYQLTVDEKYKETKKMMVVK